MNTPAPSRSNRFFKAGFSLVEVVLAVGIMALGVVTILGLLPHGLEVSRQTANEQAESRIIDSIVGELQAMDWVTLNTQAKAVTSKEYLYDDQGLSLEGLSDSEVSASLSYVARVDIPDLDVYLPTNAVAGAKNYNLRRVVIDVAATPLKDFFDRNPLPASVPVRTFTQLIARTR
jgi:uncharacterized protein (TIGR02598 family)